MYKYICVNPEWSSEILMSISQVRECIYKLYPGTILPNQLDENILNYFNIYKVVEDIVEVTEPELLPYMEYRYGIPYKDGNGTWRVNYQPKISGVLLDKAWEDLRTRRNQLLQESDWIEASDIVTTNCKNKYKLYRQLLRDCLNVTIYPSRVVFPKTPLVEYKYKRKEKTREEYLSQEEIETIKNYKPDSKIVNKWNEFLLEWSKTKFNMYKRYVSNLIKLYTDLDYEAIFKL